DKIAEKYGSANTQSGAGGKATLQLAGAFAFSYTDHDVKTLIKSTADLNSNDDMELTSAINEELALSAESTGEEQPGKTLPTIGSPRKTSGQNPRARKAPNTSADTAVSAAIVIGVENNASHSIIESDAHLDSMRALRLLSGVTYPFLTRPDEFVPT